MGDHPHAFLTYKGYDVFVAGDMDTLREPTPSGATRHAPGAHRPTGDFKDRHTTLGKTLAYWSRPGRPPAPNPNHTAQNAPVPNYGLRSARWATSKAVTAPTAPTTATPPAPTPTARKPRVERQDSTDHRDCADSTDPVLSHDPAETNDRAEPIDPTDSALPIDPTDRLDPTDPMDSTEPTEPIDSTESFDQRDNTEPVAAAPGPVRGLLMNPSCPASPETATPPDRMAGTVNPQGINSPPRKGNASDSLTTQPMPKTRPPYRPHPSSTDRPRATSPTWPT